MFIEQKSNIRKQSPRSVPWKIFIPKLGNILTKTKNDVTN